MGVLKAKFVEAMYENIPEFPMGGGSVKQKPSVGGWGGSVDIFLERHIPFNPNELLNWLSAKTYIGYENWQKQITITTESMASLSMMTQWNRGRGGG